MPEAYWKKFRSHVKAASKKYVEFAREKKALFDKWCLSSGISTLEQLQVLSLLKKTLKALYPKTLSFVAINKKFKC